MAKLFTFVGPILLLVFYTGVVFFIRSKIPNTERLLATIEGLYGTIGYPLILLAAIAEATFLLGFYVPGSAVVLLGAALSRTGVVAFPLVYLLGTCGLVTGYTINYFLGKYGWYHILTQLGFEKGIEKAQEKIITHGRRAIFLGYILPSSASFFSTAAGVLGMPFKKFLITSIVAQSFWSLLWGTLAFFFGVSLVEFLLKNFGFVVVGIVTIWVVKRYVLKR